MADIVWANRGVTTGVNNDNFLSVWGTVALAEKARLVIDAVIRSFERVITSFNRPDGTNQLLLNISMDPTNHNETAFAPAATLYSGGKPKNGGLLLGSGDDGHGSGYFVDPTPDDNSEFVNYITAQAISAYTANSSFVTGPFQSGYDLYSVAAIEMTHNLGLSFDGNLLPNTSGIITNTFVTNSGQEGGTIGTFFKFQGPSVHHLLTNFNSAPQPNGAAGYASTFAAHSSGALSATGPGGDRSVDIGGVTYWGSEDTFNAMYSGIERTLISEPTALMMKDGLGYSIVNPNTLPNMYSILDSATGKLTLRGMPTVRTNFNVSQSGSTITVSVDPQSDTPATGSFPGAGNLPAYVTTYDAASVTGISIIGNGDVDTISVRAVKPMTISGGGGDDVITVYSTFAGVPLSIDGGEGNDAVHIGDPSSGLDAIGQSFTVAGGIGTDTLFYEDAPDNFAETYTVSTTGATRALTQTVSAGPDVERFVLNSGSGASTFNIVGSSNSATTGTLNAGAGNDTFVLGASSNLDPLSGTISLVGEGGTDAVQFRDAANTFNDTYTITPSTFTRTAAGTVNMTVETITLFAGSGSNTISVGGVAGNQSMTINSGNGNDTVAVGNGNLDQTSGPLSVFGDAGTDSLVLADQLCPLANVYGIDQTSFTRTAMAPITYTTIEAVTLNAGTGSDVINVTPSTITTYAVNGNLPGTPSGDQLTVNIASVTGTVQTPSSATAGTFTFTNRSGISYTGMESSATTGGVNALPVIGSLAGPPNPVLVNTNFSLTASGVTDADGSVSGVAYYRESNGTAGLQVGSDTPLGDGSYFGSGTWSLGTNTNGLSIGAHNFYASATDNLGATSAVAAASVTVSANTPPVVTTLTATPNPVVGNTNFNLVAFGMSDADGFVASVTFYRESNGIAGLQISTDLNFGTNNAASGGIAGVTLAANQPAGTYTYYAQPTDNLNALGNVVSTSVVVTPAPIPPAVVSDSYLFNTAPLRMVYRFDSDVSASLAVSDLTLRNIANNAVVAIASVSWNAANKDATFFLAGAPIPDGNYRATLIAGGVTNAAGTPLAANRITNFHALAGDLNRDRAVNFDDLLILAQNYGQSGRTFSQGNIDYSADGLVGFDDLLMLAQRYGSSLATRTIASNRKRGSTASDVIR